MLTDHSRIYDCHRSDPRFTPGDRSPTSQIPAILKFLAFLGIMALLLFIIFSPVHGQIAVRGEIVYPVDGPAIADGVVLIKDHKIEAIGPAGDVSIPDGYRLMSAKVVTPGLIDAHSVVGLAGYFNQPHDQDQLDRTHAIQPELRAMDAYNGREKLVEWLRDFGVTTLHTGHAPGGLITGQSIVVKTDGQTLETALVDSAAMLTMTLGPQVAGNFKKPGTRAKGMAMIREAFIKAQEYQAKKAAKDRKKRPGRNLQHEVLGRALSGQLPVLITAQNATEIMTALRLSREFNLKLIIDGAAESYLLLDELKAAGVSIILHPPMTRNYGTTRNVSYETAAALQAAGIPFAFQSGYESYVPKTRVVLFEAAIAAANGLSFDATLAALTINAAKIIGQEKRIGSLTVGKDADLVLFDGDPFEYTSHVCGVIINGKVVSESCR